MTSPGPSDRAAVFRRRMMLGAATVAATAWLTAGAQPTPPSSTAQDGPARKKALTSKPVHAPALPAAVTLAKPIFTLAGFREVVPGPAFASHAIALTIDDGPHPVWTPKILKLLERYHVPATFFLIGNQVRGHESVARSVADAGHQLANHTYTHPTTLPKFAGSAMHTEIERAQDKIYSATGHTPKLFRSPGGSWSAPLMKQIAQAGLVSIDWTDDPDDWKRPGTAAIVNKLLAAKPGQILLCTTAAATAHRPTLRYRPLSPRCSPGAIPSSPYRHNC